ncbi:hypothetical protein B0H13DRAFT_1873821 [Mycena leptocephala]|nr:hypothetical protein B0H13DRAFT_1873821 [Mycena leptocephala]
MTTPVSNNGWHIWGSGVEDPAFIWETDFPESGLSAALRAVRDKLYGSAVSTGFTSNEDIHRDVLVVRKLFHHFRVPVSLVPARMAAMNMERYWAVISANTPISFIIDNVPQRAPGETGPLMGLTD